MTDGLIVKEPYATQLVTGKKNVEFRSKPLPKYKTNVKIFILNGGFVKGYVVFSHNDIDDYGRHMYHVSEHKQFSPYMKYKHKNGCIVWINNVDFYE